MKYRLLKDFPHCHYAVWVIDTFSFFNPEKYPDFFEPIIEKKTYDSLRSWDKAWYIWENWDIKEVEFDEWDCRSETFLTREEAEDEHKRREWACRKDRYIPEYWDHYYVLLHNWCYSRENILSALDYHIINSWLAFKSIDEAMEASVNNNLQELFYTIR